MKHSLFSFFFVALLCDAQLSWAQCSLFVVTGGSACVDERTTFAKPSTSCSVSTVRFSNNVAASRGVHYKVISDMSSSLVIEWLQHGSYYVEVGCSGGGCSGAASTTVEIGLYEPGTVTGGNTCPGQDFVLEAEDFLGTIIKWQKRGHDNDWEDLSGTAGLSSISVGVGQYRYWIDMKCWAPVPSAYTTVTVDPVTFNFIGGVHGDHVICPLEVQGGSETSLTIGGSHGTLQENMQYRLRLTRPDGSIRNFSWQRMDVDKLRNGIHTPVTWNHINEAGTYDIYAKDDEYSCEQRVNSAGFQLSILGAQTFAVSGGGEYCHGSDGPNIYLSGSEPHVKYRLYELSGSSRTSRGDRTGWSEPHRVGDGLKWTNIQLSSDGVKTFQIYAIKDDNANEFSSNCHFLMGKAAVTRYPTPRATLLGGNRYDVKSCKTNSVEIDLDLSDATINYTYNEETAPLGEQVKVMESGWYSNRFLTSTISGQGHVDFRVTPTTAHCQGPTVNFRVNLKAYDGAFLKAQQNGEEIETRFCEDMGAVEIEIDNPLIGVTYHLTHDGVPISGFQSVQGGEQDPYGMPGRAETEVFSPPITIDNKGSGEYRAVVWNQQVGCITNATSEGVNVEIFKRPIKYELNEGPFCELAPEGFPLSLYGSEAEVIYRLYNGADYLSAEDRTGDDQPLNWNVYESGGYSVLAIRGVCEVWTDPSQVEKVLAWPAPVLLNGAPVELFGRGNATLVADGAQGYRWSSEDQWPFRFYEAVYSSYFANSSHFNLQRTDFWCAHETDFEVNVYPVPQLTLQGTGFLRESPAPELHLSGTDGLAAQWYKDGKPIATLINPINQAGTYKVIATAPGGTQYQTSAITIYDLEGDRSFSADQPVPEPVPPINNIIPNLNHVRTFTPRVEFSHDLENNLTLETSLKEKEVIVTTQYTDGLGRNVQSVGRRSSPSGHDLVTPIIYDRLGRQPLTYLSYTGGSAGDYHANVMREQYDFYQASDDFVANAKNPYASTRYENSPLGRVLEEGSPGEAWYPGVSWDAPFSDRRTIKFNQRSNRWDVDGPLVIWEIDGNRPQASDRHYPNHSLLISEVRDEHDLQVLEFTTRQGQTILRRSQGDGNQWLDTHYVYDDFGNLRFVLPPKVFESGSSLDHLDELAFQYQYDHRQRLIAKRVPGSGWSYFVYDQFDRLRLTQDANQSLADDQSKREWTFTKYDPLNRPAVTGIWKTDMTVEAIRMEIDKESYHDVLRNTSRSGYNLHRSFPGYVPEKDLLSITYYDDYNFLFHKEWDEEDNSWPVGGSCQCNMQVEGLVTGSKVRVLGSHRWLNHTQYYDDRYRLIGIYSENLSGKVDRLRNEYDFSGNIIESEFTHRGYEDHTILREYSYDHGDRLLQVTHTLDEGDPVTLVVNHYNEIGELIGRDLHATVDDAGQVTDSHQKVDYRYNIRGWLKSINQSSPVPLPETPHPDLFGMEVMYHTNPGTHE